MSENVYPLPAVRGPERGEHHVWLVDIYLNEELSAGDPAEPGPKGAVGYGWNSQGCYWKREGKELQIHQVPV